MIVYNWSGQDRAGQGLGALLPRCIRFHRRMEIVMILRVFYHGIFVELKLLVGYVFELGYHGCNGCWVGIVVLDFVHTLERR